MLGKQTDSVPGLPLLQKVFLEKKLQQRRWDDASSSVAVSSKDKHMTVAESPKDKPVLTDGDSVKDAMCVGQMSEREFQARLADVGHGNAQDVMPQTNLAAPLDGGVKGALVSPAKAEDFAGGAAVNKAFADDDKEEDGRDCGVAGGATCLGSGGNSPDGVSVMPSADQNSSASVGLSDDINAGTSNMGVEDTADIFSNIASVVTLPIKPHRLLPNITLGRDPRYVDYPLSKGIELELGEASAPSGAWSYKMVEVDGEKKIRFTPFKAGEYDIPVTYNGGKRAVFQLTVNSDPWDLWTIKPMSEKDIVFETTDRRRLETGHKDIIGESHPGLCVIGASRRGRSHEHSGTFRDDDMGVWSDEANGNYVFVVSDGAGSCKYSREGALQAINCIKERLEANKDKLEAAWRNVGSELKPDCSVGMLLAVLASKAKEHLVALAEATKADGKDCKVKDFSGTLLMAALKIDPNGGARLVTFSIGDGAIAWRNANNQFELMCRPDSGEFGGGTRFLVTPEVWKTIFYPRKDIPWSWNTFCDSRVMCRTFSVDEAKGLQIYLMSDGVSDPWFETDAGLENPEKWREFATDTLLNPGENKAALDLHATPEVNAEKLWEWLYFKITGNHDDRTIIMAYITDGNAKEVFNG